MGWIRSNWLDFLIFLLVAVIMAGVVFFLTGVNPLSAFRGGTPAPAVQAPNPAPAPQPQPTPQPAPRPQAQPQPAPSAPQAQEPEEPVIQVIPVPKAPDQAQADPKPVAVQPKVEDPPEPQQPAPQPQPAAPRVGLAADAGGAWRVTVGAFADAANAQRLSATLRGRGYPARLEPAASVTRVWVGPYASEARARAVAATLSGYGARVSRGASPSVQSPAPAQPAQPQAQPAARYVQVGAFRSQSSADALVAQLRGAGFPAFVVVEGALVKVRVGPVGDADAARLRARGLSVLEVR